MTEPAPVSVEPIAYASWPRRVAACVVDGVPVVVLAVVALGLVWVTRVRVCDGDPSVRDLGPQCGSGVSTVGQTCLLAAWVAIIGYCAWNVGYRQGVTGSSLGKAALGFRVVGVASNQPIGFWRSVIRQLMHVLDALTFGLGYLWPLWDRKHQTFADKLMSTVCVSERRSPRSVPPR